MKNSKSIMYDLALPLMMLASHCTPAENPLVQQAETVLKSAGAYFHSISTRGGYVGIYSVDLQLRYGESFFEEAIEPGLGYMMKSQFDNGAWPQWYP